MLYMNTESLIKRIQVMIDSFFATDVFLKRPDYYNCISFPIRIHHYFEVGSTEGGFVKNYVLPFYVDYSGSFLSDQFHIKISRDCRSPVSDPEISVDCGLGKQELCNELKDYILRHLPIKKVPSVTYEIKTGCNEVNLTQTAMYEKILKCESEVNKKMLNGKYGFKPFKPNDDYIYTLENAMRQAANFVRCKVVHGFFALNSENGIAWKYHSGFMKLVSSVSGEVGPKITPLNLGNTCKRISVLVKLAGEYPTSKTFEAQIDLDFAMFTLYDVGVTTDIGMQITSELKDYICRELGLFNKLKIDGADFDGDTVLKMIAPRGNSKTKAQAEMLWEACLAGKHVAFINRHYTDTDVYKKCMDYCDEGLDDNGVLINRIEKVIFSNPATIVFWKDGTKTTVTAKDEPFDEEKGLAMAIAKKALGNNYAAGGRFKAILKHAERVEKKEKKTKVEKPERPKITKTGFIKEKMSEGFTRKEATEMWERSKDK